MKISRIYPGYLRVYDWISYPDICDILSGYLAQGQTLHFESTSEESDEDEGDAEGEGEEKDGEEEEEEEDWD